MPPGAAAARRRLLLTFGSGPHGCLGLGSLSTALAPTVVAGPLAGVDVVQVSCGGAHTALVDGEGYAWTFGLDDRGQLGRGGDPRLPGEVLLPEPVVAVAAGGRRTVFVGRSGRVWEAGDAGPQGDGILGMRRREAGPRLVPGLPDGDAVVGVACGEWHALACTAAGRVLAWGVGPYGQLGGGRHNRSWVRAALLGSARGVQEARGSLEGRVVRGVACGAHTSGAIDEGGRVHLWGLGTHGQLAPAQSGDHAPPASPDSAWQPIAASMPAVTALALGTFHGLAATMGGGAVAWGTDQGGCLGLDSSGMHLHPSPLPALHARALRGVAAGMSHSAAVTAMGEVYAWGDAGHLSSFADEGRAGGRLGLPGRGGRSIPTVVPGLGRGAAWEAVSVSCGAAHTAVIAVGEGA